MAEGKRLGEIPDEIPLANSRLVHYRDSDGLMRDAAFSEVPLSNFQTDLQHNDLPGGSAADAHPIGSITGLQGELDAKKDATAPDGHVIEDDGTPLAQRSALNFTGTGLTITDDGPGDTTNIDVAAGVEEAPIDGTAYNRQDAGWTAAAQGGHTIQDEGVPLPQQNALNFVGADVAVADEPGQNRTTVTITTPPAGEVNDGTNVGSGTGAVYRGKSGTTLDFKTLRSSDSSVQITNEADTVNLQADFEPKGSVAAHEAAPDPHGQYLTEVAAGTLYAPISHQHTLTDITDSGNLAALNQVDTAEIVNDAVDNTKLSDMPANTIKGNDLGASGNPKDLTITEAQALLDVMDKTTYDPNDDGIVEYARTITGIVNNNTGGLVVRGTPIYVDESNNITVAQQSTSQWAIGVLEEDIANGASGRGTIFGRIFNIAGFNTTAASIGDPVYLGASGGLTLIPTDGRMQQIGQVQSLELNGDLFVNIDPNVETPVEGAHASLLFTGTPPHNEALIAATPKEVGIPQADLTISAALNMIKSVEDGSFEFDYSGSAYPAPASINGIWTFGLSGTVGAANVTVNVYVGLNGVAQTVAEVGSFGTGANQTADTLLNAAGTFMVSGLAPTDRLSLFVEADSGITLAIDHFHLTFVATEVASAGGGVVNHNDLQNRNAADAHSIAAITGLQAALDGKVEEAPIDGTQYSRQDAGWVSTAGGHVIEDEGTPLPQQSNLNFVGAGVTAADSGGKTVVTIPGGGGAASNLPKFSTYSNNNGTMGTGTHIFAFSIPEYDNNNDLDGNGAFIVPENGEYRFRGSVHIISNVSVDATFNLLLRIDNVNDRILESYQADTSGEWPKLAGTASVILTAGQKVELAMEHDDGSARNYQGGQSRFYFQGELIPDTVGSGTISNPGVDAHVIADEGVNQPHQPVLNFTGDGVTVSDGTGETIVDIPGGGAGGGHVIQDEGSPLPQRANLNFVGSAVTVTDDSGNDASVVNIVAGGSGTGSNPMATHAYLGTNQALPATEVTKVALDTVVAEDGLSFNTTNNEVTVLDAGWYTISGGVQSDSVPSTEQITASLFVAGVAVVNGTWIASGGSGPGRSIFSIETFLSAGSVIDLRAYCTAAVTLNSGQTKCYLSVGQLFTGGPHEIRDEDTPLTQRPVLDFQGAGVTVTDDSGNNKTVVTVPGGGGGGHVIQDEGVSLPARANLNFIGSAVTVTDNPGNDASDVTLTDLGEANTGANVGTGVVGLYDGKTGTALDFRTLNSLSSAITVALDGPNQKVDFDLVAGNISHTALADIGTNTHAQIDTHISNAGGLYTLNTVGTSEIDNDAVTFAKMQNIASASFIGRQTAGTGDPENLTAAQARAVLNVADGANNYVHPNHTGDVSSAGDGATTISNNAVSNAKAADMAPWTLKGRNNSALGDPQDFTDAVLTENGAPGAGDFLLGWTAGALRKFDVGNLPTGGGGEANLGANVGSGDADLFRDKTGVTLNFKRLRSSDASVTITNEADTINLQSVGGPDTNRISSSKTLFVDNDPSPVSTPEYTTITAALAAATDGDLVVVMPGLYQELITIPNGVTLTSYQNTNNNNITSDASANIVSIEAPPGSNLTNQSVVTMAGIRSTIKGIYVLMSTALTYSGTINSLTGRCSAIGGIGHILDCYVVANCNSAADVCALEATGNALFMHNSQAEAANNGAGAGYIACAIGATRAFWLIDSMIIGTSQINAAYKIETTALFCIAYNISVRNLGMPFYADIGSGCTLQSQNTYTAGLGITGAGTFSDLDQITSGAISAGTDSIPAKWSAADIVSAISQHESGEANLGANIGNAGEGIYDGKTGNTLNLRNIAPDGADTIVVTLDAINNNILLGVFDENIDHNLLTNYVPNEHIDWTQPGAGLIDKTNYDADSDITRHVQMLVSDPNGDDLATGTDLVVWRAPATLSGWVLKNVAASVTTVSSSGAITVQVRNNTQAADMLSTPLTIDQGESDSTTAATPPVIDPAQDDLTTADQIAINVTAAGTGVKGLIVDLEFTAA